MITEKKVLLIADAGLLEQLVRFEALEVITDISEVQNVWSCNKTPVMMREFYAEYTSINIPVINVPNELRDMKDILDFCHGNGFECGEKIEGQKFDTRNDDCFLCRIGNHSESTLEFNKTAEKISDLIIYESENFFIKIELGCLIPGMIMVNPKQHCYSMARLPEELFNEYYEVMHDAEELLKATYGEDKEVIFFEHGSAPTGYSSHAKSIVHAHTHLAIGCEFPQKYLDAVQLKPIKDIRELYKSKYMSYQVGTKGELLAVNDPRIYVQRQYPRQVIGLLNGIPSELCNWRIEPFEENIKQTFDDLFFSLNSGKVTNNRILERTNGFVEGYPMRKDFNKGE